MAREIDLLYKTEIEENTNFLQKVSSEWDAKKNEKNFQRCVRQMRTVTSTFVTRIQTSISPISLEELESFLEYIKTLFTFIVDSYIRFSARDQSTQEHMSKIKKVSSITTVIVEVILTEEYYKDEDDYIWGILKTFDTFVSLSLSGTSWVQRLLTKESLDILLDRNLLVKLQKLLVISKIDHFWTYMYRIPKIIRKCGDYQNQFLMLRIFKQLILLPFSVSETGIIVKSLRPQKNDNFQKYMTIPIESPNITRLCLNDINDGIGQNQFVFSFPALYVGIENEVIFHIKNDEAKEDFWINFSSKSNSICFNLNVCGENRLIEFKSEDIFSYCFSRIISESTQNEKCSYCIFHVICKKDILAKYLSISQNRRSIYFIFNESSKFESLIRKLSLQEHEGDCTRPLTAARTFKLLCDENEDVLRLNDIQGIEDSGNIEINSFECGGQNEVICSFGEMEEEFNTIRTVPNTETQDRDVQTSGETAPSGIIGELQDSSSPLKSMEGRQLIEMKEDSETPIARFDLVEFLESPEFTTSNSIVETEVPRDYEKEIEDILTNDLSISPIDPLAGSSRTFICSPVQLQKLPMEKDSSNQNQNVLSDLNDSSLMSPYYGFKFSFSPKSPTVIDETEPTPILKSALETQKTISPTTSKVASIVLDEEISSLPTPLTPGLYSPTPPKLTTKEPEGKSPSPISSSPVPSTSNPSSRFPSLSIPSPSIPSPVSSSSSHSLNFTPPTYGSPPTTRATTKRNSFEKYLRSIDQMPPPIVIPLPVNGNNDVARKLFSSPEFSVLSETSKPKSKNQYAKKREFNVENVSSIDEAREAPAKSYPKKTRPRKRLSQIINEKTEKSKRLLDFSFVEQIQNTDPYEPTEEELKNVMKPKNKTEKPKKVKAKKVPAKRFFPRSIIESCVSSKKKENVKATAFSPNPTPLSSNSSNSTSRIRQAKPKFKFFKSKN